MTGWARSERAHTHKGKGRKYYVLLFFIATTTYIPSRNIFFPLLVVYMEKWMWSSGNQLCVVRNSRQTDPLVLRIYESTAFFFFFFLSRTEGREQPEDCCVLSSYVYYVPTSLLLSMPPPSPPPRRAGEPVPQFNKSSKSSHRTTSEEAGPFTFYLLLVRTVHSRGRLLYYATSSQSSRARRIYVYTIFRVCV